MVDALYASGMYREDQNTFMLYPIVELPSFVDKNLVGQAPGVDAVTVDVLIDEAVLDRDANGELHFSSGMVNAAALSEALAGTVLSDAGVRAVLDMYESVFQHHRYTGRSGSMHGYEGIGSIYWHMVGKLAVSVQEAYWRAIDSGESDETVAGLADAYRRVRAGLGFCKSPTEYGAIPTDCYSHTPSHAGAQQPGMTGHVKELIITRFGELGIRLEGGILSLSPGLLDATELFNDEAQAQFSYCGIPVLLQRGAVDQVRVEQQGQWNEPIAGHELPADHSAAILSRTGEVTAVEFTVDSF